MSRFQKDLEDLSNLSLSQLKFQVSVSLSSQNSCETQVSSQQTSELKQSQIRSKTKFLSDGKTEAQIYLKRSQIYLGKGETALAANDLDALTTLVEMDEGEGLSEGEANGVYIFAKTRKEVKEQCEALQKKVDEIQTSRERKESLQRNLTQYQDLVLTAVAQTNIVNMQRGNIASQTLEEVKQQEEIQTTKQTEREVKDILESTVKEDDPVKLYQKLQDQIHQLQNIVQQQQQQINTLNKKQAEQEILNKDSGLEIKAKVNRGFQELSSNPDLFLYCKTFYWTTLNILNAYKIVSTGIVSGNHKSDFGEFLESHGQQIASTVTKGMEALSEMEYIKQGLQVTKGILKTIPFVGNLVLGIDDIVSSIISAYNFAHNYKELSQFESRVTAINHVILSKFYMEDQISLVIAQVALKLTELKKSQISSDASHYKSNQYPWFKEKLDNLKNYAHEQLDLPTNSSLETNGIVMLAVRDVSLFMAYICQNSEVIIANKNNSIEELIQDIITHKSFEKLVKDKTKSLLEKEKTQKENQIKQKQKKEESSCSIF